MLATKSSDPSLIFGIHKLEAFLLITHAWCDTLLHVKTKIKHNLLLCVLIKNSSGKLGMVVQR